MELVAIATVLASKLEAGAIVAVQDSRDRWLNYSFWICIVHCWKLVGSFICIVLHQPMENYAASRGGPGWSVPAAAVLFAHG